METSTLLGLGFVLAVTTVAFLVFRRGMKNGVDPKGVVGELKVIGEGEAVIDRPLKRSRGFLTRIEDLILVEFLPDTSEMPSCVPHHHDHLSWDIVSLHPRDHVERCRCGKEQMYVRVKWRVATERTIMWMIRDSH